MDSTRTVDVSQLTCIKIIIIIHSSYTVWGLHIKEITQEKQIVSGFKKSIQTHNDWVTAGANKQQRNVFIYNYNNINNIYYIIIVIPLPQGTRGMMFTAMSERDVRRLRSYVLPNFKLNYYQYLTFNKKKKSESKTNIRISKQKNKCLSNNCCIIELWRFMLI